MNQKLVIIGARAMGRETCAYAIECGMEVKGFLDSETNALDGFDGYPPILDSVERYHPCEEDVFVVALGEPAYKIKYAQIIVEKGGRFISIIHPTSYVGKNVKIGVGCIICPHSTITNDVRLGEHVIVNVNASISHDCVVEDYVTISPGCHMAGGCKVGAEAFMGVHSALLPHVSVGGGGGVFVAAGAVVTHSVASGCVMGVPAKPKR